VAAGTKPSLESILPSQGDVDKISIKILKIFQIKMDEVITCTKKSVYQLAKVVIHSGLQLSCCYHARHNCEHCFTSFFTDCVQEIVAKC